MLTTSCAANLAPARCGKARHHHALVEAEGHGHAHHPHAVDLSSCGSFGVVRGQHRDLVTPLGQRLRQPLDVDRQAAHVGPVIGQDEEDLHANSSRFAFTHSTSRAMPSRTLTCGAQPNSRCALLTSATKTGWSPGRQSLNAGGLHLVSHQLAQQRPEFAQIDSVLAGPPPRL